MESQTPETRIKVLENAVGEHDRRITAHGEEIDALAQSVTEMRVHDRHRDETINRMEGKLDSLLMKPGMRWDYMITAAVGAVVLYVLYQLGIHS